MQPRCGSSAPTPQSRRDQFAAAFTLEGGAPFCLTLFNLFLHPSQPFFTVTLIFEVELLSIG
jgi:hypothetical protein